MHGGEFGRANRPKYRCVQGRQLVGAGYCPGAYVMVNKVENAVREWLGAVAAEHVDTAARVADAEETSRVIAASDEQRLLREVAKLDEALTRLTVQLAEGIVPMQAYRDARKELEARRTVLLDKAESAGRASRAPARNTAAAAGFLLTQWDDLPLENRRELLRALVSRVVVWSGAQLHVEVIPTWS